VPDEKAKSYNLKGSPEMKKQPVKQMSSTFKPTQDNFFQAILSWILASGTRLKPFQAVRYMFY